MFRIVCITVTHQSDHAVAPFLDGFDRLRADSRHDLSLVAVDNASSDRTVELLRARGVEPIVTPTNLGYGAAHNLAFERLPPDADFVLLLNPDVVLGASVLDRLLEVAGDPTSGAVVPWLERDRVKRPCARPDYGLLDALFGSFGWRRLRSRRFLRSLRPDRTEDLRGAYAEGSCMLLRRDALFSAGPFDPRFFVFFDDVDLDMRLRRAGLRSRIAGDAVALEFPLKGSRAADRLGSDEERIARYLLYLESELCFVDKWFGPSWARLVANQRRAVDLPLLDGRWRKRHGISGLAERALPVVEAFLAGTPDSWRASG